MEYHKLGDLEGHLNQHLTEAEASLITKQLLEGLDFMHTNNFAHRDLKPGVRYLVPSRTPFKLLTKASEYSCAS